MRDPFPGYRAPFEDPFAAFVMSEFHAPDVEARIRHEELAAIPGQIGCSEPHSPGTTRFAYGSRAGTTETLPQEGPCSTCGASV